MTQHIEEARKLEPVAFIVPKALQELEKHSAASATIWSGRATHRFVKDACPLVRLSDAQAAIAAAEESGRPRWQPIDTAPKRGTILLWDGRRVYEGYWGAAFYNRKTKKYEESFVSHPSSGDTKPTHWMPLPEPPAITKEPTP